MTERLSGVEGASSKTPSRITTTRKTTPTMGFDLSPSHTSNGDTEC